MMCCARRLSFASSCSSSSSHMMSNLHTAQHSTAQHSAAPHRGYSICAEWAQHVRLVGCSCYRACAG
jgi:hypothetical protein